MQVPQPFSLLVLSLALAVTVPSGLAQQQSDDLSSKSLEDLMNIQVTSVSKKEQQILRTPAAIFVISAEDIRRSGALDIPDLLRMVPGLDVAQIDANTWAISARGFNEEFSDKLLVLIDGRSVYTPTFGGVFWQTVDVPLQDIERIEVIRGPGGTIWGANAVNGVINIITQKASDTRGESLVSGGGNIDQGFGTAQYGGKFGRNTSDRAYIKYGNYDHMAGLPGQAGGDGWDRLGTGFRVDTDPSVKDTLTVQGDLYGGHEGEDILSLATELANHQEANFGGGNIQMSWGHSYSARSDSSLQVSFDRYVQLLPFTDKRNNVDAAFQYHFAWGRRQDIVAGTEYVFTNHLSNSAIVSYGASDNTRQFFSAFVQDEIAMVANHLFLTLGSKIEHNEYTGFADMPSGRLAWQVDSHQMFWLAISRSQRIPTSGDTSDRVNGGFSVGPGGTPLELTLNGNPNFQNETLLAYEAGYRAFPSTRISLDLSSFFNQYHRVRTIEPGALMLETAPPPQHYLETLMFANGMYGETHGLEASLNWQATPDWTLSPGYAFEAFHMHLYPWSHDTTLFPAAEGGSPSNSAQLRSQLKLPHGLDWNASAYFVERLASFSVPSYTRVDTGATWHFAERASLSIVGQNLVSDHHLESQNSTGLVQSTLVKRSAYAQFALQF